MRSLQKNGERVRSSEADRIRARARDLAPPVVRAAPGGAIDDRVRVGACEARRARDRGDARARRAVPEVWLSPDPGVPDETWAHSSLGYVPLAQYVADLIEWSA